MKRVLSVLVLLTGCSEYSFDVPERPEGEPVDTDVEEETDEPIAEAPIYANTSERLYEVEPETGDTFLIGDFRENGQPVDGFVDIAIDTEGRMYGGTYDALYRINPTNATVVKVCDTDVDMTALAFAADGRLFAGGDQTITRMDIDTCGKVPHTNSAFESSGDLVGLPDGYLYWTVRGANGDELVRIDPNSGGESWVGAIGTAKLFGLGYDETEDKLFGFSSEGFIVSIEWNNANRQILAEDQNFSWWGATTNPVVWSE